jgi:hypothetical protein
MTTLHHTTTVTAADLNLADQKILCKGGRTGTKIHFAFIGSSVLDCGTWVKHDVRHFKVTSASVENLCDKCFAGAEEVTA